MITFKDITREKNNSQKFSTQKWLRDRDFKVLADNIPGILYIHDVVAHRNIYINCQTYNSLGYTPQASALTAYAGEIDRQKTFQAGSQKHIAKPINISEIIAIITELLQQE